MHRRFDREARAPEVERFGTVVCGKDEDRVLRDAQFVERVEQLARVAVDLRQEVRPESVARVTLEVRMRHRREVRGGVGEIDEEGLSCFDLSAHEVDGPIGQIAINQRPIVEVIDAHRGRGSASGAVHHVGGRDARLGESRQGGVDGLVGRVRHAVPLVEPLVRREAALGSSEMPLAEHPRGVPRVREHLGHRDFPLHEAVDALADRNRGVAAADRVAPRHQRRARRRALHLDVEVGQPQPLGRQLIEPGRGGPADDATAVEAGLSPAEVVHEDEHDVGLLLGGCSVVEGSKGQQRNQQGSGTADSSHRGTPVVGNPATLPPRPGEGQHPDFR